MRASNPDVTTGQHEAIGADEGVLRRAKSFLLALDKITQHPEAVINDRSWT